MTTDKPVALVTGGSAGIGEAICRDLLDDGFRVLNLSRRESNIEHADLHDFAVDLADVEETKRVAGEVCRQFDVTHLVHNAGVIRPSLVEDVDMGDVDYVSNLHIKASIALVQGVLAAMKKASYGRIVLIGSRAMLGLETRTAYSATKAAQIGLVRTWALELGKYGITVNAVAPGPIVTDMFTDVVPEDSDKAAQIADSLPVGRLGRPADVAHAVSFLLGEDAGFITGQCLMVCGGASLGGLAL